MTEAMNVSFLDLKKQNESVCEELRGVGRHDPPKRNSFSARRWQARRRPLRPISARGIAWG